MPKPRPWPWTQVALIVSYLNHVFGQGSITQSHSPPVKEAVERL